MTGTRPEDSPPPSPSPEVLHPMATLRKVSGPILQPNGSPRSTSPFSPTSHSYTNGTSPSNNSTPWGPPATLGGTGKSGKFIERLQNENASLRRDYNVEKSAKEEAQKSLSTSKALEAKFRADNARLEMLHSTNMRALERKDAKIAELKAALEKESERRISAEKSEGMMAQTLDRTQTEKHQAVGEAREREARERANAEALRDGLGRMQSRYERIVQGISKEVGQIRERERENRKRVVGLEVSGEQGRREMQNSDEVVRKMGELVGEYKRTHEGMLERLQGDAEAFREGVVERGRKGEQLVQEMEETRDKMKWVINMDRMQRESKTANTSPSKTKAPTVKGQSKR